MFPRWQAVIEFTRQWYFEECGCLPTQQNVKDIFGVNVPWECFKNARLVIQADARAVLEAMK